MDRTNRLPLTVTVHPQTARARQAVEPLLRYLSGMGPQTPTKAKVDRNSSVASGTCPLTRMARQRLLRLDVRLRDMVVPQRYIPARYPGAATLPMLSGRRPGPTSKLPINCSPGTRETPRVSPSPKRIPNSGEWLRIIGLSPYPAGRVTTSSPTAPIPLRDLSLVLVNGRLRLVKARSRPLVTPSI